MCHPFEAQLLGKSLSFSSCAFLFAPLQKKCQDSQKVHPKKKNSRLHPNRPFAKKCQDSQKVHPKKDPQASVY
jgi:hypothetical protein